MLVCQVDWDKWVDEDDEEPEKDPASQFDLSSLGDLSNFSGGAGGLDGAVDAVRARGTIINIAVWEKPVTLDMQKITFKERKYIGIATYAGGDFQEVRRHIGHVLAEQAKGFRVGFQIS